MKNSEEYEARLDVAAAHRLAVMHGLNEGVWNHISPVSYTHLTLPTIYSV